VYTSHCHESTTHAEVGRIAREKGLAARLSASDFCCQGARRQQRGKNEGGAGRPDDFISGPQQPSAQISPNFLTDLGFIFVTAQSAC